MEAIVAKMDALYLIKEMLTNQQYIDLCETVQKEYFAVTGKNAPPPPNRFTGDLEEDATVVIKYKGAELGTIYLVEENDEDMVYDIDGNELEGYKFKILFDEDGFGTRLIYDNGVCIDEVVLDMVD
jgi:hypothetical protein